MRQGNWRLYEVEAVTLQGQAAEKARSDRQGMHGGADVMSETGKGQLSGPGATADGVIRFEDRDGFSGLGQPNGGG